MLKHTDIWGALDALAAQHRLSPSGLARRSGLDATAFNPSKRTPQGKQRWPSTESLAKVLDSTGETLAGFVSMFGPAAIGRRNSIPVIGYAQAGGDGLFNELGHPCPTGWEQVDFPELDDQHAYALKISGDSMEPVYRHGDVIIVSPLAAIHRGDRVVVRTPGGLLAKQLVRATKQRVDLHSFNPVHTDLSFPRKHVHWIARIVWASQGI
jgi:phage repressor protein C with HTH and peptisase S24 domain